MFRCVLAVEVGKASHIGCVRLVNEDAIFIGTRLFAVADGMGGHAAGDVASRTALEVLAGLDAGPVSCDGLRARVVAANEAVVQYGRSHPQGLGLGTTVAGIALITENGAPHWAVFNIGDSRVYHLGDGLVRQVTVDHSEVQELVAAGLISRREARRHPSRHIVTRAIGEWPAPLLDVVVVPAIAGHRWLITSDGLTAEIEDDEIALRLGAGEPAADTAAQLVAAALEAGGHDNVSVIVVDVTDTQGGPPAPAEQTTPRDRIEPP